MLLMIESQKKAMCLEARVRGIGLEGSNTGFGSAYTIGVRLAEFQGVVFLREVLGVVEVGSCGRACLDADTGSPT